MSENNLTPNAISPIGLDIVEDVWWAQYQFACRNDSVLQLLCEMLERRPWSSPCLWPDGIYEDDARYRMDAPGPRNAREDLAGEILAGILATLTAESTLITSDYKGVPSVAGGPPDGIIWLCGQRVAWRDIGGSVFWAAAPLGGPSRDHLINNKEV